MIGKLNKGFFSVKPCLSNCTAGRAVWQYCVEAVWSTKKFFLCYKLLIRMQLKQWKEIESENVCSNTVTWSETASNGK